MRKDQRSDKAKSYRHLYNTARWLRTRTYQLKQHPLCQRCLRKGHVTQATVCHHLDPRQKDNPATFYLGPFESRCTECHNSLDQQEEKLGFTTEIGSDGWPSHPGHPANVATRPVASGTTQRR